MNSSRQHYQLGGHLKIFENSFYVSFDARNNLTINYNKKIPQSGICPVQCAYLGYLALLQMLF